MATSYVQITLADHLDARSAVRLGLPSQEFRPGDQIIVLADDARSLSAAGYVAVASVISAVPLLGGPNVWTGTQSFTGATITGLAGQADLIGTYAAILSPAQTISYNADGSVASVTLGGVVTSYTYNTDGTVATETRAGVTRTYTYVNGNLASVA